jgi:hypothetical protein
VHLVIFLAKKHKTEYRTSTNRTESVEMYDMHLAIFLAKKYKTEYRTSTNRAESVGVRPVRRPLTRPGDVSVSMYLCNVPECCRGLEHAGARASTSHRRM